MSKRSNPKATNGKPPVRQDLNAAQSALFNARSLVKAAYIAIDTGYELGDDESFFAGVATLRQAMDALQESDEQFDQFSLRLFHEGCRPDNVKKLERESRPRLPGRRVHQEARS